MKQTKTEVEFVIENLLKSDLSLLELKLAFQSLVDVGKLSPQPVESYPQLRSTLIRYFCYDLSLTQPYYLDLIHLLVKFHHGDGKSALRAYAGYLEASRLSGQVPASWVRMFLAFPEDRLD